MFVSALPREITTSKVSLFYPMRYDCLINIMRKNIFSHFWHFSWHFIQLSIFQLPVVKLLEVLAHYANTGKETLSPFIDSSIDKVLFQTNAGSTSRFSTSQTFLNFIWQTHCCMTVKPCNRPVVRAHRLKSVSYTHLTLPTILRV